MAISCLQNELDYVLQMPKPAEGMREPVMRVKCIGKDILLSLYL